MVVFGCTKTDELEEKASKIVDLSETEHSFIPKVNQGTGIRKEKPEKGVDQLKKSVSDSEVSAVATQTTPKDPESQKDSQTLIRPIDGPLKPRYQYVPTKKKTGQNKQGIINESKAIPGGNRVSHEERIKEQEQIKKAIDNGYDIVVDENGKMVGVSNSPIVSRDSNGDYFFHDPKEEFRLSNNKTESN